MTEKKIVTGPYDATRLSFPNSAIDPFRRNEDISPIPFLLLKNDWKPA
ncbi:MAG TPA: hypothetical protein PKA38_05145 [Candidatus Levybacteria bacterium]|nr:hypothetical protein [Candidatus Levybacteria bacterium]